MEKPEANNETKLTNIINKLQIKSTGFNLQYSEFMEAVNEVLKTALTIINEKNEEIKALKSKPSKKDK